MILRVPDGVVSVMVAAAIATAPMQPAHAAKDCVRGRISNLDLWIHMACALLPCPSVLTRMLLDQSCLYSTSTALLIVIAWHGDHSSTVRQAVANIATRMTGAMA
jgi:hypothetical protein